MLSEVKNIIISISIFILCLICIIIFTKVPVIKKQDHTDSTYSAGRTERFYKKGKDSVSTKTKTYHIKSILKPSGKDSLYSFSYNDSLYNISINFAPGAEGGPGVSMEYLLNLSSKDLIRIDTLYQLRVDTLKIKETISERINPPFYNTFIFGVIAAGAIILLLISQLH
ncbi:MAG: hypothetical protein ACYDA4_05615 [Ignavibacteriaceae bacterium]